MCLCISNTSLKVLCFPFSFQNLGIRCVKKKEVKEAIISRLRAGINPFNGMFDMTIYIICVSQILFLLSSISIKYISFVIWTYVFKAILSSVFTSLLVNLHLDLRNEVYLKLSVLKINFYADRCQWRVSFFFCKNTSEVFCFSLNVAFLLTLQQTGYTALTECWIGNAVIRYCSVFNSRAYSTVN